MERLSDHLYIPPMGEVLRQREEARKAELAKRPVQRHYAAARVNRLNADWTTSPYGANFVIYRDLRVLRARAREMSANAGPFRKFLRMAERNVVGHQGIMLQCRAEFGSSGRPNTNLNKAIERAWWEWSFAENCSASGKLSLVAAQKLFVRHLIRDGEVLVEHIDAENPFGYALKFWNVDWLDETFNEELTGGNRVIMSVEVDPLDRPVAYWLTTPASEINFTRRRQRQRTRIPAEKISHAFLTTEDESQTRGVTWFHAALLPGKGELKYTGGVIESASMAAMSGGFFTKTAPDGLEGEYTGGENNEGLEVDMHIDHAPAAFHMLPEGWDFKQFDPKQPTQNHAEFKKSMGLDIAQALDVCGFSLSGDMSAVNYSSARVGLGEERDVWRDLQTFTSEFLRVVYHKWLRSAIMAGKITVSPRDFEQLQNPSFRPRGWRYVDPQKEIAAHLEAIGGNLATYTGVLAEQGVDVEEFLIEKQQEKELFEKYGVDYAKPEPAEAKPGKPGEEEDTPKDNAARGYTNGLHAEEFEN